MLLLKSLAQFLLIYKCTYKDPTQKNCINYIIVENLDKCRFRAGLILAFIWLAFCEVFIIIWATHNNEDFISEWLFKYFICILCEFILVDTIKLLLNSLWLSMAKSEFVNCSIGKKLTAFVDIIYYYFT